MDSQINFTEEFPLGRRFGLLMRMYFGALTKKLEELDIDRHYSILILLENAEKSKGTCSQQDVSNILKIDKASMVRNIDYLVKKKYIKRTVNPVDRREHNLILTAKARKTLPTIHEAVQELNTTAFAGLSKASQKGFYQSLDILARNLAEEPAHTIIIDVKKAKSARK
ncbi:MAG TPA: MarR family transcriptional regulator [Bacteroidia bacterium]|jgi:DNA-binding MarR family transcriptional regulator|nr:MarR family transcriptional regulator [Bacteroidia bacterium]